MASSAHVWLLLLLNSTFQTIRDLFTSRLAYTIRLYIVSTFIVPAAWRQLGEVVQLELTT